MAGRADSRSRGWGAALAAVLLPVGAAAAGWWAAEATERWLTTPAARPPTLPVIVDVPRGTSGREIVERLTAAGLVERPLAFGLLLRVTGDGARMKAGEYLFERPQSPLDLVDVLVSGRVLLHPFTIPEGLDLVETAEVLSASGWWSTDELVQAFRDPSPAAAWDPGADDLEGYLFPDTYHFARDAGSREVAAVLAGRFGEVLAEEDGVRRAVELGRSVREVATLASLVEKETALPDEHGLVASVFHNRLRRGMKLECDPTVIHALVRDGRWHGGPLRRSDLKHDSPYNTYVSPGLPPGPIASFGRAALRAALEPEETDWLFFVASGDGGHRFAKTLAEHRRNVTLWRRHQREAATSTPN